MNITDRGPQTGSLCYKSDYRILIMATGFTKENKVPFKGSEFVTYYGDMSVDPEVYEGKTVLILGKS